MKTRRLCNDFIPIGRGPCRHKFVRWWTPLFTTPSRPSSMLHAIKGNSWRLLAHPSGNNVRMFTSSTRALMDRPNPPLNLDPSLKALLKDVDMSLVNHKSNPPPSLRELEILPTFDTPGTVALNSPAEPEEDASTRKSPAAHFGSHHIGAVVLPSQLRETINLLISGTKMQLNLNIRELTLSFRN